jgi:hypothetical protein
MDAAQPVRIRSRVEHPFHLQFAEVLPKPWGSGRAQAKPLL